MDVSLADAVQKFPALYDESKKEHHDKFIVNYCWVKVAAECWLENTSDAIRLFQNLKKRYNKACNNANKPSGSGLKDVKRTKQKLDTE